MRPASVRNIRRSDVRLAAKVVRRRPRAVGVALRTILEGRRNDLQPSEALAVIEHESRFRNIFGCDRGGPYCHQRVTRAKVRSLVRHVLNGGVSNGVGHGQLTWLGYIQEAERDGGAHRSSVNIATAMKIMGGHKRRHGWMRGLSVYNSGSPTAVIHTYSRKVDALKKQWHDYLT